MGSAENAVALAAMLTNFRVLKFVIMIVFPDRRACEP